VAVKTYNVIKKNVQKKNIFISSNNPKQKKSIIVPKEILSRTTIFKIDKTCFLSSKPEY